MAASAAINRNNVDDPTVIGPQIVTTQILYAGAYQCVNARTHGTVASVGRVQPYTSTANQIPVGFQRAENKTGDTSATPIPRSNLWAGPVIVKSLAITGLAGTFADVGRIFYATADDTFTLTRTDPDLPLGIITDFETASVATARFFSMAELAILAMAGAGQSLWSFCIALINTASTYLMGSSTTGVVIPYAGRILSTHAICVRANTDVDVSQAVAPKINDTAVTGGSVALVSGNAAGLVIDGSAVSAANVFHAGDLLQIYATQTTSGTATDVGTYNYLINVLMEPGL